MFKEGRSRNIMKEHAVKILAWADNLPHKTNLRDISNGTGVPVMSVHYILWDFDKKGENSILSKAASLNGYTFTVNSEWKGTDKCKRKKEIIISKKV